MQSLRDYLYQLMPRTKKPQVSLRLKCGVCHVKVAITYSSAFPNINSAIGVIRFNFNTKKGTHLRCVPKGGDYLLFRFRSTIGVIRFNFSVRNGKRWSPYAVFALISFQKRTRPEAEKTLKLSSFTPAPQNAFAFYGTFGQLVPLGYARHHACTCGLSTSSSATALGMRPNLGAGFVLRCFQHLSCPDAATRLCPWRDNRCTGGPSGTVLSY